MPRLPDKQVFTIGHSTHAFSAFLELLEDHGIASLIDVRRAPRSRRMPHFSKEYLAEMLPKHQIGYLHEPGLGGWRKPAATSPNAGWRNKSFQGYADYMETTDFKLALDGVMSIATERRSAVMCAEALWWHCHRMLISDALAVRGWRVCHILGAHKSEVHRVTSFAIADGQRLTYPPTQGQLVFQSRKA